MKTAEEWLDIYTRDGDGEFTDSKEVEYVLRFAKAIQADALRHAANIAYENFDRQSHEDITEEADKLETK